MPATVEEFGKTRKAKGSTVNRVFGIKGVDTEAEAMAALLADSPTSIGAKHRQNDECDVDELGPGVWVGTAYYAPASTTNQAPDSFSLSFDISGLTQRIQCSLETIGSYAASGAGTPPDYKGAINVQSDGTVEGTDIIVPYFTLKTMYTTVDEDAVDEGYIVTLGNIVGTVNDATFKGFASGTLLLTGVSGQKRFIVGGSESGEDVWVWDLAFSFAVSANKSSLTVGGITGIVKNGWDFLWVSYREEKDTTANVMVKRPKFAYVERVYEYTNYGALGLP